MKTVQPGSRDNDHNWRGSWLIFDVSQVMNQILVALLLLLAVGEINGQSTTVNTFQRYEAPYFHGKGHPWDWDPKYAKTDAEDHIRNGILRAYLGDQSSSEAKPVGIPYQLYDLLSDCRFVYPGFTDVIVDQEDQDRRSRQFQYARIYNQELMRFLLARKGRDASELERTLADKEGETRARRANIEKALAEVPK